MAVFAWSFFELVAVLYLYLGGEIALKRKRNAGRPTQWSNSGFDVLAGSKPNLDQPRHSLVGEDVDAFSIACYPKICSFYSSAGGSSSAPECHRSG